MSNKSYSQKLQDPRWQKKRLEILSRDEFTCQWCYDTGETLHVHHKRYEYGRDPWDYPDNYLITLCKKCHKTETDDIEYATKQLVDAIKLKLLACDIQDLADSINATDLDMSYPPFFSSFKDIFKYESVREALIHASNVECQKRIEAKHGKTD